MKNFWWIFGGAVLVGFVATSFSGSGNNLPLGGPGSGNPGTPSTPGAGNGPSSIANQMIEVTARLAFLMFVQGGTYTNFQRCEYIVNLYGATDTQLVQIAQKYNQLYNLSFKDAIAAAGVNCGETQIATRLDGLGY